MKTNYGKNILIGALLCRCLTSDAIELFDRIPLPDYGHGSTALGSYRRSPADGVVLLGFATTVSGEDVPYVWLVDNNSNSSRQLPTPAGAQGNAIGGTTFSNGDMVAIGNLRSATGNSAVLWRKPASGDWSMPVPLASNAAASTAWYVDNCGHGDHIISVTGSLRTVPVIYLVGVNNVITEQLPLPLRANAEVLGVSCADTPNGERAACGYVTYPAGPNGFITRPIAWVNRGQGWATFPLDFRSDVQGRANAIKRLPSGWAICGTLIEGARSVGFITKWEGPEFDALWGQLPPLRDEKDSSADSFSFVLDGWHDQVFGTSSQSLASSTRPFGDGLILDVVATGWIGRRPFEVQQLLSNPQSVGGVRSFRLTDAGVGVGQIIPDLNEKPEACVFIPTGTLVPDLSVVTLGQRLGSEADLTALWHHDGNEERIVTELQERERKAVVDLVFSPGSIDERRCMFPYCGGNYVMVGRAESIQPGASGALNIYGYDNQSGSFKLLGSFNLTDSNASYTIPAQAFDWTAGAVHIRLEFIQNGNAPTALGLDSTQFMLHGTSGEGEK